MTQDDLDARLNSYSHRQLVVVTADEIVAATRAAEESAKEARDAPLWTDIANAAINAMRPWAFNFIDLTAKAVESWANARQRGLNVLQISRSEASRLVFPPGHPRDGVLYIGHPALPHVYYAASSFHRIAFEHKFSEAIDLLMHLGATEIRVEHVRGWSREFAARLSVPLPSAADELTASARAKSADSNNILYEARLRGSDQPALPSTLVWYPHEPTWQSLPKGDFVLASKTSPLVSTTTTTSVSMQDWA